MIVLKDRSLREIGSELIVGLTSVLAAPLKIAMGAAEKVIHVLCRLWTDFVSGNIKTLADVVSAALKAVWVVASVGVVSALEVQMTQLCGLAGPIFGEVLAAICAGVVAGVMIAVGNRSIEWVVQSLFMSAARRRREDIEAFCDEMIPKLVADRDHLEELVASHLAERRVVLASTFSNLQSTRDSGDIDGFLEGLQKVNLTYGQALQLQTFEQFDHFMQSDRPLKI